MFNPPFFKKYKVETHETLKEWFFDEHSEWVNAKENRTEKTVRTDYFYYKQKPYELLVNKHLKPYFDEFANEWNVSKYVLEWWFAQYDKGGNHPWHIHPTVAFAAVYALELPNSDTCTDLQGRTNDMQEGDLIIFPGCWPHQSPANLYNEKKTVIVANMTFKKLDSRKYE